MNETLRDNCSMMIRNQEDKDIAIEPQRANDCDSVISRKSVIIRLSEINKTFSFCLLKLQLKEMKHQYNIAYLSTLGGAYHLCNRPRIALAIAIKMEKVGYEMSSAEIIFKSKLYQAVNLVLLGYAKRSQKIINILKNYLKLHENERLQKLLDASIVWYESRQNIVL